MSILHTDLFPSGYPLLRRAALIAPGSVTLVTPTGAVWWRALASGAGGFKDDAAGWGGGAAYAFANGTCVDTDAFTAQIGDSQFSRPSANTVAGNSWVKQNGSVIVLADRGRYNGNPGLASNSTGAITRDGSASTSSQGGASAGDAADALELGFGGRGASATLAAYYGGGGGYEAGHDFPTFPAGDGRVIVEFYSRNPGY